MRRSVDTVNKTREGGGDDVLDQVHGLMHLVRSLQYRALQQGPGGVTHMESKVLGFVARHPGATLRDLVAHAGRDKGQLARLVGGLKERGLLEARADDSDRRSQCLFLTGEGAAADQAVRRRARKLGTVAVKGFSEAELGQLRALLDRVRANLEAAGGD